MVRYATVEEIRKVLGEELSPFDGTFQWEHFLRYGLDALFLCRVVKLDGTEELCNASMYWKQLSYTSPFDGELRTPKNLMYVTIYSRYSFMYPRLYAYTKLPRYALATNENARILFIGFEDGSSGNIVAFVIRNLQGNIDFRALIGRQGAGWQSNYITSLLPSDFDTSKHRYYIAVTRNLAIFEIDEKPVHFVVLADSAPSTIVKSDVKPYGVSIYPFTRHRLTFLLEQGAWRSVETEDVVAPIAPYSIKVGEGSEIQPLSLQMYLENSDTRLAGYSVSSGSITSHPIPVYGYENKTLYFMADQAGTLSIQILTLSGNWREYDSVSVSANRLLVYRMAGEALLARVVFTPSTYPANILEAEAHLS